MDCILFIIMNYVFFILVLNTLNFKFIWYSWSWKGAKSNAKLTGLGYKHKICSELSKKFYGNLCQYASVSERKFV